LSLKVLPPKAWPRIWCPRQIRKSAGRSEPARGPWKPHSRARPGRRARSTGKFRGLVPEGIGCRSGGRKDPDAKPVLPQAAQDVVLHP
jgi:hypothetical protein